MKTFLAAVLAVAVMAGLAQAGDCPQGYCAPAPLAAPVYQQQILVPLAAYAPPVVQEIRVQRVVQQVQVQKVQAVKVQQQRVVRQRIVQRSVATY